MEFVFDNNYEDERDDAYGENAFQQALYNNSSSSVTTRRRGVATSYDDVEFNPPIRTTRRSSPKLGYVKTTATQKKWLSLKNLTWGKVAWVAAVVLLLRLVFMDNGILDYQKMNETIAEKERYLVELRQENVELIKELKLIKTSSTYQKKMAREHLGVIASDEYLVVISK